MDTVNRTACWSAPLLFVLLAACGNAADGDGTQKALKTAGDSSAIATRDLSPAPASTVADEEEMPPDENAHLSTVELNEGDETFGPTQQDAADVAGQAPTAAAARAETASHVADAFSRIEPDTQQGIDANAVEAADPIGGVRAPDGRRTLMGDPSLGGAFNNPDCDLVYYPRKPRKEGRAQDPLFTDLWHLHNFGNFKSYTGMKWGEDLRLRRTWRHARGDGVRVAVVDQGMELLHPDLRRNVIEGASYNYRQYGYGNAYPFPCHANETHGTMVAGVIAARAMNGRNVAGVAPRARMVSYNFLANPNDLHMRDALLRDHRQTHIYNNSWGHRSPGWFLPSSQGYADVISTGLQHGRGGLGSIYVFSAGNDGCRYRDNGRCVPMLANYSEMKSLHGTLSVCATTAAGKRASYSNPGSNLLVCAPTRPGWDEPEIRSLPGTATTTVRDGDTNGFNGTSAAAPQVSGVVALMLEANPNLTWRDVPLILARTARKVDPASPRWTDRLGLHFHHEYGFGVANASAAVRAARKWRSVGGSSSLRQCGPYTVSPGQAIPQAASGIDPLDDTRPGAGFASSNIAIPAACAIQRIEHVDVTVDAAAQAGNAGFHVGQLQILLTSPLGQTSILSTPRDCLAQYIPGVTFRTGCGSSMNHRFGVARHMNEPAALRRSRDWKLSVADRVTGGNSVGELRRWSITLYGR